MASRETFVAELVRASEFVAVGLATFDRVTPRMNSDRVAKFARRAAKDGLGEDSIEAFADECAASVDQARGNLYRELWTKALELFVTGKGLFSAFPGERKSWAGLIDDIVTADRVVWASLQAADDLVEGQIETLRGQLDLRAKLQSELGGTGADAAAIEAEIKRWRATMGAGRSDLHRRLWTAALEAVAPDGQAA